MFPSGGFDEILDFRQPWFKLETVLERKFLGFSSSIGLWKIWWEASGFSSCFSFRSFLMLVFDPFCFGFVVMFEVERGDTCRRQNCWWLSMKFLGFRFIPQGFFKGLDTFECHSDDKPFSKLGFYSLMLTVNACLALGFNDSALGICCQVSHFDRLSIQVYGSFAKPLKLQKRCVCLSVDCPFIRCDVFSLLALFWLLKNLLFGSSLPTNMIEKTKKQKKGSISEEDVSTLLQRYTATTVLALLQEVAQYPGVKLNWNALVKKTTTGISNAREYQMLWRHLAYRNSLLEKFDDGAEPLDDDSDLEYELEPCPSVSGETSAEAAACVKVLIASGLPSDSSLANSSMVDAPLTINIPNSQSSRVSSENSQPTCSMRGLNITVPVSVQKQILPAVPSAETLEGNGSAGANLPARRKRKPWSEAEDMELISAVQRCGVGNWANILRGDFKGDRTASQLAQVVF
ncbi:hypothetical protein V6N13_040115 [Hibiscus sabdariffa]